MHVCRPTRHTKNSPLVIEGHFSVKMISGAFKLTMKTLGDDDLGNLAEPEEHKLKIMQIPVCFAFELTKSSRNHRPKPSAQKPCHLQLKRKRRCNLNPSQISNQQPSTARNPEPCTHLLLASTGFACNQGEEHKARGARKGREPGGDGLLGLLSRAWVHTFRIQKARLASLGSLRVVFAKLRFSLPDTTKHKWYPLHPCQPEQH